MMIVRTMASDLPAAIALALFLSMIFVWSALICGA